MSLAKKFIDSNDGLRHAMTRSATFDRLKDARRIVVAGRELYVVRGDSLGSEEDLYVESLIRGAGSDHQREPYRSLFLELGDELKGLVRERAGRRHEAKETDTQPTGMPTGDL